MESGAAVRRALVIEDDPSVAALVHDVLVQAGLEVTTVTNGEDGVQVARTEALSVITVDVNLPGIDGFETVRRLRAFSDAHIMMISALSSESDAVLGLAVGADDYIIKPFRVRELRARIDSVVRRQSSLQVSTADADLRHRGDTHGDVDEPVRVLRHRDVAMDTAARLVVVSEDTVELTMTEFELLRALLESGRAVRNKHDLSLIAHGESASSDRRVTEFDRRAVEVHIANLRRKLGETGGERRYIETVRGLGYRLTADPGSDPLR